MPAVNGSLIRERRERLGVKVPAFAKRLGISRYHLANLELGHKRASIELVHLLARELDIDAEELLDRSSDAA